MRTDRIRSLALLLLSLLPLAALAQKSSGDEQGLTMPTSVDLPEDSAALAEALGGWWRQSMQNHSERTAWYREARFGCFIHWGVYASAAGYWHGQPVGGYSEHIMRKAKIPLQEYMDSLVYPFNPTEFDADEWMRTVAQTGMRYFIITAKHHDGFAMYPSDAYPYDIRLTRFHRDPMRELRDAARRYGIKFGFYYSHAFDWEHPDAPGNDWEYDHPGGDKKLGGTDWWTSNYRSYLPHAQKYVNQKAIPQIRELINNYQPDILWFDTPSKLPLYMNIGILKAVREADPECRIVVNGRLVRYRGLNMGDYISTGDRAAYFAPVKGLWESIPTTNESYGYNAADHSHKPAGHFVRLLAKAVSRGGNILMNVGPMGNGRWSPDDLHIFHSIGQWMNVNGRSIYGAGAAKLPLQPWGVITEKQDTLFLHVFKWPKSGSIVIGGYDGNIISARLLADKGRKLSWKRIAADDISLSLGTEQPDTMNSVVELVVSKRPDSHQCRRLEANDDNTLLTFDGQLAGRGWGYGDGKVNRNYLTNWTDTAQSVSWQFRLADKAKFRIVVEYNTAEPTDRGEVMVELDGKQLPVAYTPCSEQEGTNRISAGTVELRPGTYTCRLLAKSRQGRTYMRPTAVLLLKD